MKTSVIIEVRHPDIFGPELVASLIGKMVSIGIQEAHDSLTYEKDCAFDGANEAVQLVPGEPDVAPSQPVNVQVLKSLIELLYVAEGSDPHDFDEDTQRIFNEAQAARDAACDPCPDCHAREVLCESCGGLGYVPKPVNQRCKRCGGDRDADTGDAMQPGDTLCASCDAEERDR